MLRLVFMAVTIAPLMGGFFLVLKFAPQLINDSLTPWAIVVMLGYSAAFLVGYYVFLDRIRPRSDIAHLKVPLEEKGARVESVSPYGVRLGGRYGPDYRIYRARVKAADGSETVRIVSVEATLFGGGEVQLQSNPRRLFGFSES